MLPDPRTKKETYLKSIADGENSNLPDPRTKTEIYLKEIAENPASGIQGPSGEKGDKGDTGVGITDITSDGTNITFHLSDDTTKVIPWPTND